MRRKLALLIGIKDPYGALGDGPVNNCRMLAQALIKADPSWHITTIVSDAATLAGIMTAVGSWHGFMAMLMVVHLVFLSNVIILEIDFLMYVLYTALCFVQLLSVEYMNLVIYVALQVHELVRRANAADKGVAGVDGSRLGPVVLVYYSGHGLQLGAEQYMVPSSSSPPKVDVTQMVCVLVFLLASHC